MKSVIENFYKAFSNLDAEGMAACYHKDIKFEDPAFGVLEGQRARDMWRMLCESQKGKDFKIIYSGIQFENEIGKAHWEAFYPFSRTGRKVHNKIDAEFRFKDGKIIHHIDQFDLYRWSRHAMGISGYLLGWTPFFKKKLNAQTNRLLTKFEKK
jgi:ketosteroid isomerase-like protein